MIIKLNIMLAIILIFAIAPSLYAENEVGNGGDAFVCKKEKSISVILLDYHEGIVNHNKLDSQKNYKKIFSHG